MYRRMVFWLFYLFFLPTLTNAIEPTNLAVVKHQLKQYHDSGQYQQDLAVVIDEAMHYLQSRLVKNDFFDKKPAIVLDIDETALSNYTDMLKLDFGGTMQAIQAEEDKGTDEAILATLKLYRYAKAHQVAVFFLTGRNEVERAITTQNLAKAGYKNWDGLILRSNEYRNTPASIYKIAMRKRITQQGYHIVLNIGDQNSDLKGGVADKTFKLPNPYYFIP